MELNGNPGISTEILKVFESLPEMYLILSVDLRILTASDVYLQVTKTVRESIVGKSVFDKFKKDGCNITGLKISLQEVLISRRPHQLPVSRFDISVAGGKPAECYWLISNTPVLDENGEIQYIINHAVDVTQQTLSQRYLNESLEKEKKLVAEFRQLNLRLEKFFAEIPAYISSFYGSDFIYDFVNEPYKQYFLRGNDVIGKPLLEVSPALVNHPLWPHLLRVYQTGQTFESKEMYIEVSDGNGQFRGHYFNLVYQALFDTQMKVNGVLTFAYDVTEFVEAKKDIALKESELARLNDNLLEANEEVQAANEELRASNESLYSAQENLQKLNSTLERRVELRTNELLIAKAEAENERERLKRFFMQAPAGISIMDGPEHVFELVNSIYEKLLPGREFLGKPILKAFPELKGQSIIDILDEVYRTGKPFEGREWVVPLKKDGNGELENRYFNFIYQPRFSTYGKVDGIMAFGFEVTDMVKAREMLESSEKRFRFVLDAMPQHVWTASADGQLNYVNQLLCDDFGRTYEEILQHGWSSFVHPDDLADCVTRWNMSLRSGESYSAEFRLLSKDGYYRWFLGRALPLVENGTIKLWVGTSTNIDIHKTNEQRKDEFISIASHELKTPLTSIKAYNQLMQRTGDLEKLNSFVAKSAGHILRLEKLISDLLDVTKINAGKILYNLEEFDFLQMLTHSIESVQHTAPQHEIILERADDVLYTGDRFRLEQVVNNFLNNAIKYSPEGGKVIVNSKVSKGNIIVSVRDFGIGIAEQDLNHLFERYFRVDNTAMRFEGLGLGLFIASEILKRHNGSFWIESEPGKGATFYFRLPLVQPDKQKLVGRTLTAEGAISISFNETHNYLNVNWTGGHDLDSVKLGCKKVLAFLQSYKTKKMLVDTSFIVGIWPQAGKWMAAEWYPELEEAGIKFIACVYLQGSFSQFSIKKCFEEQGKILVTKLFTDCDSAENWIDSF